MTQKEKYLQLKAEYIEIAKSVFSFQSGMSWVNKRKLDKYHNGHIKVSGSTDALRILAGVITAFSGTLMDKVILSGTAQLNAFKSTYESEYAKYKQSVTDGTEIDDSTADLLRQFKSLRSGLAPISSVGSFEVVSDFDGLRIQGGFSELNRLIVDVLNENIDAVHTQFKKAVTDEFNTIKAELKKDLQDTLIGIG